MRSLRLIAGIAIFLQVGLLGGCAHRSRPRVLTPREAAVQGAAAPSPRAETASTSELPSGQLSHPDFEWPLAQLTVINFYGWRGRRRVHEGVDFRASTGTPVYASASGRVIHASRGIRGYGRLIVIDHGGEWSTVYAHLSRFKVRAGQRVSAGALIGYSGRSGRAHGPHLHFEIRKGSDPLDPLLFLGNPPQR